MGDPAELFHDHCEAWSATTRDVEFVEMPVKRILNRCDSPAMPFGWTINPYRGCEFGCVYCYARYTHEFLDLRDPMDFERRIFVKRAAASVLARTLGRSPVGSQPLAIGTATDPYQPAEREYGITRSILEVLAGLGGMEISITTKSALIARDIDLLGRIARRSRLSVNFSLITLDRHLQRIIEPRAPRPELRLRTLERLTCAGIRCNILMMPVIPGITDGESSLEAVIGAARRSGARAVWWRSLFLRPAAARRFIPFIAANFPHLKGRFDAFYSNTAYAPKEYDARIGAIFDQIRTRHGFPVSREPRAASSAPAIAGRQLSLLAEGVAG
jgi:DNA repair photolyase